jgi:hypothetical protein
MIYAVPFAAHADWISADSRPSFSKAEKEKMAALWHG